MKNRHYLIPNSFTFIKVLVKEGWTDRETGKKGEPRLQFSDFKMLQDVFETFAKKLTVLLDVRDLNPELVSKLRAVFQANIGDNSVIFEVLELERIKRPVEALSEVVKRDEKAEAVLFDDEMMEESIVFSEENPEEEAFPIEEAVVEEVKIITKLEMPSRKLKVKISNELLQELEQLQVNFKLN